MWNTNLFNIFVRVVHGVIYVSSLRSVNFISLVTSCIGLEEEGQQTAHLMSFTWASHIAACVLTGR